MADQWIRVSSQHPCPICRKPNNCTVAEDGNAVWCGRVADGAVRQNGGGQFLHFVNERQPASGWCPPPKPVAVQHALKKNWRAIADAAFRHPDAAERRKTLADSLCVSEVALESLRVGWRPDGCWTFPERDPGGNVIGISRRFQDGGKRFMAGGSRGLTFADAWLDSEGPVFLPEGATCAGALISVGLCAIGRPSNTGGTELLTELLRCVPDDRQIIVLGENDRRKHSELSRGVQQRHKPDCELCLQCWPGWCGALQTAEKLRLSLCRDVGLSVPPENEKDARSWLCHQKAT